MKSTLRILLLCGLIIGLGVAGFIALKATRPSPPKAEQAPAGPLVRVQTAQREDIRAWVHENATVAPKTTMDVIAEVSGIIVEVSPNLLPGYFVNKGELLVKIDPREYKLNAQSNKAQIAQLKAESARITQEERNIRLNIELEKQKLKLAQAELERKRSLLDTASISQSEVDRQAIEAKSRETAVLAQQNALALLSSQRDLIEAKLEATRAQLELAQLKLEKTSITAPFDGRVTSESAEEGEFVPVGQKLASIFDISSMEIIVNLSARKVAHLEMMSKMRDFKDVMNDVNKINKLIKKYGPKAKVTYQWSGNEREWIGKVVRMKGQLDVATRTIPLVVEVKDPFKGAVPGKSPPLVPGMFVDVALKGRIYEDVIRVSRSAIHGEEVYLAKNGKLEIRRVKIVMSERDNALISEGLENGDKIILSPIPTAIPGMTVRVFQGVEDKSAASKTDE